MSFIRLNKLGISLKRFPFLVIALTLVCSPLRAQDATQLTSRTNNLFDEHRSVFSTRINQVRLPIRAFKKVLSTSLHDAPDYRQGDPDDKLTYTEFNYGVALVGILPFPGASLLYGKIVPVSDTYFLDAEIGIAFPSLATGKIGLGGISKGNKYTVGVRPWPFHFYFQKEISKRSNGSWILSIEVSPQVVIWKESMAEASLFSYGMINIGRRWNRGSKK